jgi:hypothetical protein
MKIPSLSLAAAAALMSFSACDRAEPTAVTVDSKPLPGSDEPKVSSLGEGRAMTREEVDQVLAMQKNIPTVPLKAASAATAPLAKTAAATCVIDFNPQAALAALTNHGSNTFIYDPYYQTCYNNSAYYMMATPVNLDHFHLISETPTTQCYGTGNNWGHYANGTSGACIGQSDAMYWPRAAWNMNSNSGVVFNAIATGYYRTFNIVGFYVRSGTVKLAAHVVGAGWRYYYPATAGQRWILPGTVTVDQVMFFDVNSNGVFGIDNLEVQILVP